MSASPDEGLLAGEFDRAQVAAAWADFVEGRDAEPRGARGPIVESWRRSRELGVDPHGPGAPLIDPAALDARRAANRELLDAAAHTWQLLSLSMAASDNVFVVTDADGVVLEVHGNPEFVAAAARQCCGAGRDWSEAAGGTNAIGTALARNEPTVVRSTEHFIAAAKVWDCAASPIRDLTDGSVLGTLDVTSVGDLSDHHTLALAVTAAHQIEHALHSQSLAHSVQLLNWYRAAVAEWQSRAAVVIDRKGRVLRATGKAEAFAMAWPDAFTVRDEQPRLSPGVTATIVDVKPYRPPPELAYAGEARWYGGIVLLDYHADAAGSSGTSGGPQTDLPAAFSTILTRDSGMVSLMQSAARMARASAPILINGETGSGKELVANAIHRASPVADGPFVAVNCGTLTPELANSELLGYEPGAFTGAAPGGRAGKFEEADGGTLFLDEIGELPLDVQVNLLRVVQDSVVVRVGGNASRQVNVRLIAATHRDLDAEVAAGHFRSDLLFRLRVLVLAVPPLRERPGDIPLLVERYLRDLQGRYGLGAKTIADDLMAALGAHAWPGNVRELHGLIESLYILSDRRVIGRDALPEGFAAPASATIPAPQADHPPHRLGDLERDAIIEAIEHHRHNMSAVARGLGISRSTLYRKLRQYGIDRFSSA